MRRIQPRLAQRADDVGEQQRVDRAHVEVDAAARPLSVIFDHVARATSSRGASSSTKRSPSASRRVAPSPRIASVTRKPSRPLMPVDRGRVELHELEVGERRARPARQQQADAERAGRVGRALPQRGRAAGGEDDRAGVDRAPVLAHDAHAAPVAHPERRGAGAFDDGHAAASRPRRPRAGARRAGRSRCRRRARRAGASGRPPGRARGCRGGRRRSARRGARGRRRCAAPRGTGRSAALVRTRPRPARSVSSRCRSGESSARQRRRQAALRPVARGARQRRGGDERDARARRAAAVSAA